MEIGIGARERRVESADGRLRGGHGRLARVRGHARLHLYLHSHAGQCTLTERGGAVISDPVACRIGVCGGGGAGEWQTTRRDASSDVIRA